MASIYRKSEIPDHLQKFFRPVEIGLEPTLAEYVDTMVAVFREVRRVLRPDGTLWLNIGDSYASSGGVHTSGSYDGALGRQMNGVDRTSRNTAGLKPKDLMMVPARVALALQDDGWWLRSDIIWAKKNCMPESVTDRPTSSHEHIFLLTKRSRYFYDAEAVREDNSETSAMGGWFRGPKKTEAVGNGHSGLKVEDNTWAGRNQRNVWHLATEPFPDAHFATFPTEIPRRCIKAGTSEKGQCAACGAPWVRVVARGEVSGRRDNGDGDGFVDLGMWSGRAGTRESTTTGWQPSCSCDAGEPVPQTVLDPFAGSGTTLLVADQLGRHGIGIELNPEYAAMCERRIRGDAPMFAEVNAA